MLLINGLGIERKDSIEVFSKTLMPNMDYMIKNYLFTTLEAPAGDYNNGYKNFCIHNEKKKEDQIDELIFEKKLGNNEIIKNICTSLTTDNKLHIFYTLNDGSKLHQIRELIKIINPNKNKKIFIHLILTATSVNEYPMIIKAVSKLSFEIGNAAKLGFVVGSNKLNTDDALRTIYREFGEHWNESTKRFDILKRDVINPCDAGIFHINKGFALSENDVILFANFNNIEYDKFYNDISNIQLIKYSLFPFKDDISHVFTRESNDIKSLNNILSEHNIKLLVLTNNTKVNQINYYLNGMEKRLSQNITYANYDSSLFNSKDNVRNLMESHNYDGVVIDINIGEYIKLDDIKQTLSSIDMIIKNISDASRENNYTFIISSTYGMHAQVNDGVVTRLVNLSLKVPCIFQSNEFTKSEYSLASGTTHDLALTFLTNICDDVKSNKILKKLTSLDKAFKKR